MRGQEVIFSKGNDEWSTPDDIFKDLDRRFEFDLDPCCTSQNQKCTLGFGLDEPSETITGLHMQQDGLLTDFEEYTTFVNPPHSQLEAWIRKCRDESIIHGSTSVMLIPARTGRTAWQRYVLGAPKYGEPQGAAEIWYVDGRISFFGKVKLPNQEKSIPESEIQYKMGIAPATFDSAIVVFRPHVADTIHRAYIQPKHRKIHAQ